MKKRERKKERASGKRRERREKTGGEERERGKKLVKQKSLI